MAAHDRMKLARDAYGAYESGDRRVVEELLTDDFTFYSPADVGIDRSRYFERAINVTRLLDVKYNVLTSPEALAGDTAHPVDPIQWAAILRCCWRERLLSPTVSTPAPKAPTRSDPAGDEGDLSGLDRWRTLSVEGDGRNPNAP